VSVPLQRSGQGSEALQYSAGDVEIHVFVQVFNQIITILRLMPNHKVIYSGNRANFDEE
jgi:hypothetical protein